ncbi:hypothetical protein BFP70_09730 [Thioclava sp. SK-1]|uniref:YbaN family protein n=1 Tax=Thioclava sp. SK-1 TaxID=1889770 RepID=UPI000825DCF2|nr:YbaN family protein [Thioclava sp. SK-1]OCX65337.1 hypothetical protein BFP70_09730 [Thioclava sp. SK-1]
MRVLWLIAACIAFSLGLIGVVLPLLPTVPFMLLAAMCFARSSERLHHWLITHPRFGPPIANWQEHGAISRRAKYAATLSIIIAFSISVGLGLPRMLLGVQAATLCCVMIFIWTRPDR